MTDPRNRNLLILASHFPPNSPGGIMRVVKLVKYLPLSGWSPVIVTSSEKDLKFESGFRSDVPDSTPVYRAPSLDVRRLYHALVRPLASLRRQSTAVGAATVPAGAAGPSKASEWLIPDYLFPWIGSAVVAGLAASRRHRISAILSTSPLASSHVAALVLRRLLHVPWLADFRDPWTTNPLAPSRRFPWMAEMERRLERRVLHSADAISVIAPQFVPAMLSAHRDLDPAKISVVPNGFDPEDFQRVRPKEFDHLTVVHAGSFYGTRSAVPFLEALARIFVMRPALRQELRFVCVGDIGEATRAAITRLGLADVVSEVGPVAHEESLSYITGASILLLIPGPGEGTMTGKLFEYIAAKKPVLALAGAGAVRDIVGGNGIGAVADPADGEAIMAATLSLLESGVAANQAAYDSLFLTYNRRDIARRIGAILDGLVGAT